MWQTRTRIYAGRAGGGGPRLLLLAAAFLAGPPPLLLGCVWPLLVLVLRPPAARPSCCHAWLRRPLRPWRRPHKSTHLPALPSAGRMSEGSHGGGDDEATCLEAAEDTPLYSNVVVAVGLALILLTLLFETLKEKLTEAAKARFHELEGVVDALLGELTVLGFIGLGAFAPVVGVKLPEHPLAANRTPWVSYACDGSCVFCRANGPGEIPVAADIPQSGRL